MNRFNDRGAGLLPGYTLLLSSSVVLLYLLLPSSAWVFDRAQIQAGAYWRLLSGHFIHTDAQHLAWNLAALVFLGAIIERGSATLLGISLLLGIGVVDVGLYWAVPWVQQYCGLSGVLNTLWIVALGRVWQQTHSRLVPLLGLAGVAKLAVEMSDNTAIFTSTVWPPLSESHLAGQIAGLLILGRLVAQPSVLGKACGEIP